MNAWRKLEARVADYFGGRRRQMALGQEQGPDVNTPACDIEVKLRKKLPVWLTQVLAKAQNWNKNKLTAVLWYEHGAENPEAGLAVVSARDLKVLLEAFQACASAPSSPTTTPLRSTAKVPRKSRLKSRPLRSRKFSSS
jgi:hypothetical protein